MLSYTYNNLDQLFTSVTNVIGPDGNVVKGYTYDEFGNTEESETDFLNDITFTSSVADTSSNLQYMNARFYQPSTGRFLSQDSYSGNAYDPWTHHLYSYCGGNPVSYIDPTGHKTDYQIFREAADYSYTEAYRYQDLAIQAEQKASALASSGYGKYNDIEIQAAQLQAKDYRTNFDAFRKQGDYFNGLANSIYSNAAKQVANGIKNDFAEDIRNFDFQNEDENVVLNSNYFSFYKGKLVIRHNIPNTTSCAINGTIWLNRSEKAGDPFSVNAVKHERGHLVQEDMMGGFKYIAKVAIPSLTHRDDYNVYYSNIWERGADLFGGVTNRKTEDGYDYVYSTSAEAAFIYTLF